MIGPLDCVIGPFCDIKGPFDGVRGPSKNGWGPSLRKSCVRATDRRCLLGVYVLVRWETPVFGYFGYCFKFAV